MGRFERTPIDQVVLCIGHGMDLLSLGRKEQPVKPHRGCSDCLVVNGKILDIRQCFIADILANQAYFFEVAARSLCAVSKGHPSARAPQLPLFV